MMDLVQPGMRVLDVGTAATGRSARLLREFGCIVFSIEINVMALMEFARSGDRADIHLAAADMCHLPFVDGYFDMVLVAFHGLDYLLTDEVRQRAYGEIGRVLKQDGRFVFNAFNRIGVMFTPGDLFSSDGLKQLGQHMINGRFLKPTLIDMNQLELHQAVPRTIIKQVHAATDLRFSYATNLSGSTRNLFLLTLFASAPYYVFTR